MFIDNAINDHSANFARKILMRGFKNISVLLNNVFGLSDFMYVACPDFSITLRQRRLILGLPIGGYINWSKYNIFPLELDINSCGVHVVQLLDNFDEKQFRIKLNNLNEQMTEQKVRIDKTLLKWNFSRRNHFINVYKDAKNDYYVVFHSSGETILFNWEYLHSNFAVAYLAINGRKVPYIAGDDVEKYWSIAKEENSFFFERHKHIFYELFNDKYKLIFADQHFGMINKGEILMGCSKVPIGSLFPILTRPFEKIFFAKAGKPCDEILRMTNGFALVPHGLGMTIPEKIIDIFPDPERENCVIVEHTNGSKMITDTLEYVGINYRSIEVIPEMEKSGNFTIENELFPVLCFKI